MNARFAARLRAAVAGYLLLVTTAGIASAQMAEPMHDGEKWTTEHERQHAEVIAARAADWRNGAIVYQVIVDRFAPAADLDAKKDLYPAPKRLHAWKDKPRRGKYLEDAQVWSHEIDFWGGDLLSLRGKLEYVEQLGADVLYLNPIHQAFTNHKYDAEDYFAVSPEYGTRQDVIALAEECHQRGLRLVLDGVFNHMGRRSPWFQEALADAESPWREWFYIDDSYKFGYRAWANVRNLPEVRLESPTVRGRIWGDDDSVVQGYLRDGVDGWRLDVAFDIGPRYLHELTTAAHRAKPGSLVVGEIWNYPETWSPAVDSVMNFHAREIMLYLIKGKLSGAQAGRMLERMIADAGLEPILKSWLILDNHDTPRLKTLLPAKWRRRMAQVLQFTLPGSPCVYYGVELGMTGGDDPEQRGPMRWDLVKDDNADLQWMRRLIKLRRGSQALRVGDFRLLDSEKLLAFMRRTDRVAETTVVVANPTEKRVTEIIALRESKLMNWSALRNAFTDAEVRVESGVAQFNVPPKTIWVLQPVIEETGEYSPYGRVR